MVARVNTVAFQGIETLDIDVQVRMASGLPAFMVVGLPDKAVGEITTFQITLRKSREKLKEGRNRETPQGGEDPQK